MAIYSCRDVELPGGLRTGRKKLMGSLMLLGQPNRGSIHAFRRSGLNGLYSLGLPAVERLTPHALRLNVSGLHSFGLHDRFQVVTNGEPFELVAWIYDNGEGPDVAVFLAEAEECRPASEPIAMPRYEGLSLADATRYGSELKGFLEKSRSPNVPYQSFFAELDNASHPVLLKLSNRDPDYVECVRDESIKMIMDRADNVGKPLHHKREENPTTYRYRAIHSVLGRLRFFLESRLSFQPGVDASSAFEQFANGKLRILLSRGGCTTQPSSALYFCFAEAAFLAIDQGLDPEYWDFYANVFTRTQRIYTDAYAPKEPKPWRFSHYGACNYPGTCWEDSRIVELQKEFAAKSINELRIDAGRHAALAFEGGFLP
jgi:hypothetical protein